MIAFNKIIKKQIISLFVFFLFYFCCNHSFGQVQLYLSVKNYSQSISIKIENNKLQIGGDNRNVIIKPKYKTYWNFTGVGKEGIFTDTEEIEGAIITINTFIDPVNSLSVPGNYDHLSIKVPLGYSAFFDTIPHVIWAYPFQELHIDLLNGFNTKYIIKINKTNKINDIVDYIVHVFLEEDQSQEYYNKVTSTMPFFIAFLVFFIFLTCFILIIGKANQKKRIKEKQERKRILDEEVKAKIIAEEKRRKEKEKQQAEEKRLKEEQERILDEEVKAKIIAEEKRRKEKEKQQAEDKRIKEEQEQKRILDEEVKAKIIVEEKIRIEKQQAEEKRIKEEQERVLAKELKAKIISKEKIRKEIQLVKVIKKEQDVFISHSSADSKLAYSICHFLEEKGIRCWIAPRDVQGGTEYAEAIIMGIRNCKIMVVLFNNNANNSIYVKNEVERAFNYKSILIPFKIDETIPSASLELFLGSVHWLNATKGNAEDYYDLLYDNCARVLRKPS